MPRDDETCWVFSIDYHPQRARSVSMVTPRDMPFAAAMAQHEGAKGADRVAS